MSFKWSWQIARRNELSIKVWISQQLCLVLPASRDSFFLHASKGLEFQVVVLVGAGRMPAEGEDEREEAQLFLWG